ncbi:sensor histidine kinase [Paenibacillus hodogayensis]|uniref:Signal transduction histidine-protein kinase/phosphatase MprB n=1 Tax=Paenibacillus hodogayensis TaxID=279208 RepID=A0ABV5W6K8_9BACL
MKLVHQINLAFGISLVLVLAITGIVIHYVLLGHFIGTQKEDMRTVGEALTASFTKATLQDDEMKTGTAFERTAVVPVIPLVSGMSAVVTDDAGNIVTDTVTSTTAAVGASSTAISLQAVRLAQPMDIQFTTTGATGYLVQRNPIPQGTLTLYTPMNKIKAIEQELLGRLLIVFGAGVALMFGLSLLITNRLIKPLNRLRTELRKVTERRFSDVELIETGGEIGSVAQTVYDMAGELNKFIQVQKHFFQNASHELKTPLMSIAGYAEGIRDGVFEGEGVRKGLDIILSESDRMKNIVTEMTLLAKLDSEEHIFRIDDVQLKDVLNETSERINPLLVRKGLALHMEHDALIGLVVRGDRDKLLQALLNIVSNAVRYARRDIYLRAALRDGKVEITVSDDGDGIPDELLPYLFHRFVKGKDGDSGLGLAIARAIVERCGGLITARNGSNGGAVFTLGFPPAG